MLEELGRRGIHVPDRLAVIGFDDVEESRVARPPLTTVRQPLYEQGSRAVRVVCDQLRTGSNPEDRTVDTELVIRRSCGCLTGRSAGAKISELPEMRRGFEAALVGHRQAVLTEMLRAARGKLGAAGLGWEERLLNAFTDQMRGEGSDSFARVYGEVLRRLSADGGDVTICNDVLSALRARVLRYFGNDGTRRTQAESLFHEARVMTAHVIDRARSSQRMRAWRGARALGRAAAMIAAGTDMDALSRAARQNLPALGIARCFVAESCPRSGGARLVRAVFMIAPGMGDPASFSRPTPVTEILRDQVLPSTGAHAFAVLPINSHDKDIGILVLELGAADGYLYETLREVFAAALTGRRYCA